GKITGAQTHNGTAGINGEAVVTLSKEVSAKDKKNPASIWFTDDIKKDDLQGPLKGKEISDFATLMNNASAYVNINTDKYPEGDIRGQIVAGQVIMQGGVITGMQLGSGVVIPLTGFQIAGGGISFLPSGLIVGGVGGGNDNEGISKSTLKAIKDGIEGVLSDGKDTYYGVDDVGDGISEKLKNVVGGVDEGFTYSTLKNIKDGIEGVLSDGKDTYYGVDDVGDGISEKLKNVVGDDGGFSDSTLKNIKGSIEK